VIFDHRRSIWDSCYISTTKITPFLQKSSGKLDSCAAAWLTVIARFGL